MILEVFAAYDGKARAFCPPFFVKHVYIARCAFAQAANDPEHQVGKHPEDYTLYRLGTFNDQTAQFEVLAQPENLGLAAQYVEVKPTNEKENTDVEEQGA